MSNDPIESVEITDEAIENLIDHHGGETPNFHPVLEVWREVLRPAAAELSAKVTPQYANRITSSYRELNLADMNEFRDRYFGKILELASILESVIESDADCLTYTTPEEDVEHNSGHYRDVLLHWQLTFLDWELDWETTDPAAAVELAAISEVHKMFFGQTGLTAFLDNIKFEFTEADAAEIAAELEARKEGR